MMCLDKVSWRENIIFGGNWISFFNNFGMHERTIVTKNNLFLLILLYSNIIRDQQKIGLVT